MSLIYEQSPWIFIILTVILGGGAAFLTGRAMAAKWRPEWMPQLAMVPLSLALRFLHFALFGADLTSLYYWSVDFTVLLIFALIGYRATLATKMARQYPWLYEKSGPFTWRPRS